MKLKELEYRNKALAQLKECFYRLLPEEKSRNKVVFKAPTGSGKTVTMACLLRDLVNELPEKLEIRNREVAFIWIAPNQLHLQSYESLKSFFEETRELRTLKFEDITENRLHPNELLFLNWQSISSEDNVYVRDSENNRSLYTYIENSKLHGTEVIVILDEAHLFGTKGEKALVVLTKINARIEIDVTATPSVRSDNEAIIPRADVVKEQMIKKGAILNPRLSDITQGDLNADLVLLKHALEKRQELAEKYREAGTKINPLMLIQLPSDSKKITSEDTKIRELVVQFLTTQGIGEQNNRLAVWLSEEKVNLDDISRENSLVDILLFKQAIAQGWDCPRASVLLIYRDLKQETFTVQTLGRILRMPEQKHYADEALNIGYVFTNLQRDKIEIVVEDMDYITFNQSIRKKYYKNLRLRNCFMERNISRNRIGFHFREALFFSAEKLFRVSRESKDGASFYEENSTLLKNAGFDMNVASIQVEIPSDVFLDVNEAAETKANYKVKFAKTLDELEQMFNRFCLSSCGDYAKDGSWERVKYHIKLFFQEYLSMGESEAYKIALKNRQKFTDLLNLAREEYSRIMQEKGRSRSEEVREEIWEIPGFKGYNGNYVRYQENHHILEPLYLRQNKGFLSDSMNEFNFITYLEGNSRNIEWWYKNGAGNRTDFAVPYMNTKGALSLFFVDFIILFKSGILGLFDSKTIDSDPDAPAKHNAIIVYVNGSKQKMTGGVVIPKDGSWRYSKRPIHNTSDLGDWEIFSPDNMK